MQRKKQACLPLSLMHSERTGGKQATNLVKENEKKQICISVKEECGVWSSVPANSSGIWVAGALAAWLGAMQTVDDTPEPAQRLTKLKFPKPSRNVMGTEEARSSWKAPRCWENGTSILTSSARKRPFPAFPSSHGLLALVAVEDSGDVQTGTLNVQMALAKSDASVTSPASPRVPGRDAEHPGSFGSCRLMAVPWEGWQGPLGPAWGRSQALLLPSFSHRAC
ncbi:uncharacterized protein [Anser cygnoides]|uniref:uncharacterized protein isoform X1 n=1 Tax=Anser cygnoides TaxID=8845 RepID=UPI0034D283B6